MTVLAHSGETGEGGEIQVRFARTQADFTEAARYMRRAAEACRDRIRLAEADAVLARLRAAGGTPATGGLFLARIGDRPVGFALLARRPNHALDMVWFHAGETDRDRITAALRTELSRLEAEWEVALPMRAARASWPGAGRFPRQAA